MSEVVQLPESECVHAQIGMAGLTDGDLAEDQTIWLRGHLERCAECRAVFARFAGIDGELTGWGERLGRENPPPAGAREQLAARLGSTPVRRRASRWILVAAAGLAAALVLALIGPFREPPAGNGIGNQSGNHETARFIEIPYVAPLDPRENATIVRMNIRVATLISVGYRVTADPDTMVQADVLMGEDGRAHAVRVLSDIDWNGAGD